jgi:transcriptional regulator with XRE-family HTH domain
MMIGPRLRQLRDQKGLSQGDIENSTGMLRGYISRVENGHTVPSLETLVRFAAALDVPFYQLFIAGEEAPSTPHLTPRKSLEELVEEGGTAGHDARFLLKLRTLATRIGQPDREVLLTLARKLATAR